MPQGDAQRVWFPMMLEALEQTWSQSMTWDELAEFCERMTAERKDLREAKGIQPPRIRCPKCGEISQSDIEGISIRSALFALQKIGVITRIELKELDRDWKGHQTSRHLDRFGRAAETATETKGPVDLDK